jgi:hypothetical protein
MLVQERNYLIDTIIKNIQEQSSENTHSSQQADSSKNSIVLRKVNNRVFKNYHNIKSPSPYDGFISPQHHVYKLFNVPLSLLRLLELINLRLLPLILRRAFLEHISTIELWPKLRNIKMLWSLVSSPWVKQSTNLPCNPFPILEPIWLISLNHMEI